MHGRSELLTGIMDWVSKTCAKENPDVTIAPDTPLVRGDLMTSLDFLRLVFFLEEKYGVKIHVDDMVSENFATPNAITDLIERTLAA